MQRFLTVGRETPRNFADLGADQKPEVDERGSVDTMSEAMR